MSDMTRKIALHCLKASSELHSEMCEECEIYGQTGCDHCYEDALKFAIASLETDEAYQLMEEQPEFCEDCISRKAALDMATTIQTNDYDGNEIMEVVDVDDIKDLPSVTPQEPRKGEWQLTDDEMFVYCPFCQQTDYTRPIDASWKYCPECGARLD